MEDFAFTYCYFHFQNSQNKVIEVGITDHVMKGIGLRTPAHTDSLHANKSNSRLTQVGLGTDRTRNTFPCHGASVPYAPLHIVPLYY
jgi:hypothetical protein